MGMSEDCYIGIFLLTEICYLHEAFLYPLDMTVSYDEFFSSECNSYQISELTAPIIVSLDTVKGFVRVIFLQGSDVIVTVTAEYDGSCIGVFSESLFHIEMIAVRIRKSYYFQVFSS